MLTAKFIDGAWVTVLLIPAMLAVMIWVKRHYAVVTAEIATREPGDFRHLQSPIVVVPISDWNKITQKALCFAYTLSNEVRAVHVEAVGETNDSFCRDWAILADKPARDAGLPPPELAVIQSPYRLVLTPILNYVLEVEKQNPGRQIAVLLPEMVERHWFHYLLHNQRAETRRDSGLAACNWRLASPNPLGKRQKTDLCRMRLDSFFSRQPASMCNLVHTGVVVRNKSPQPPLAFDPYIMRVLGCRSLPGKIICYRCYPKTFSIGYSRSWKW